jgi:hypothetical protein
MKETYDLFLKVKNNFNVNEIAKFIEVNKNTIRRWELLKDVPKHYHFDLSDLLGEKIDYSSFDEKDKDQFFTKKESVHQCLNIFYNKLNELGVNIDEYIFIEPSAGDGSFLNELPENKRIGIDIEPRVEGVIESNFLKWIPENNLKYVTIGNPPFGLRGNLAIRFINHASKFSDFVAFILPQSFESGGKGNCKDRVVGMNLIHSEKIESSFYYPDGKEVNVNVVFQIWAKNFKILSDKKSCKQYIQIYSVSDGGTPSSTRNKNMWYKCDYYLPTTCFKEHMKLYNNFNDLPQKRGYGIVILKDYDKISKIFENIDWKNESFLSTNNAYNLRFDLIENAIIKQGLIDI